MHIRSQDKHTMSKVGTFIVKPNGEIWNLCNEGRFLLGKYSSEEYALQVLNQIQCWIIAYDYDDDRTRAAEIPSIFDMPDEEKSYGFTLMEV